MRISDRSVRILAINMLCLTLSLMVRGQVSNKVLIVTGGHDFDRTEFFAMFDRMDGVDYQEIVQPKANELISTGDLEEWDLLLFYDMNDSITPQQKQAYLTLIERKKPLLFMHHSLVSYQEWPEFVKIIGGKYHTKDSSRLSNYKHDETISVHIVDPSHPVTKDVADFTFVDETYGNCEISPDVLPLLSTNHPGSMPLIGWINQYRDHQIVFLQGGHGPPAFQDPNFQKILSQAIRWCITRDH